MIFIYGIIVFYMLAITAGLILVPRLYRTLGLLSEPAMPAKAPESPLNEVLGPRWVVYVSGPIRGKKNNNRAAFGRAEKQLRAEGYIVINPLAVNKADGWEHLVADGVFAPKRLSYFVIRDIVLLTNCNAIYMLDGWQQSKGARAELEVARWLELAVMYESPTEKE